MSNRIALVTGATRGIGKAIALVLAQQGARVVGTSTTPAGQAAISAYFKEAGLTGIGVTLDVTSTESIETMLTEIKIAFQGAPEILVNNAAVTRDNLFIRMKEEEWLEAIDTNLTSVFRVTKACIRSMLKARWGRIISIGSIVGSTGNIGQPNYSAAKAGLMGFTKSVALELASRGITANVVAPGFVDTDMTRVLPEAQKAALLTRIPVGRVAQPEEIAAAVAYLASDQAAYVTGQTLHVNGGMLMD